MSFFRSAWAIFRIELTLFQRYPKLRISTLGVVLIPALYALIYLASVRDPAAHTVQLKAAIVNLDQGLEYQGQHANMGLDVVAALQQKHTFGFVELKNEDDAKLQVRQGQLGFALIIPQDFSANAVPGNEAAGGRLQLYVSEGNNYNGANLSRRFAAELGHQVNINLNEKRWSLVLSTAAGSVDKLTQLRQGAAALQAGAHRMADGVAKAESGSKALSTGAVGLSSAVGQLTDGVKQLGVGLHSMDQRRPAPQDLTALKSGSAELVKGHEALGHGLQELKDGAQKLADGAGQLKDETKGIPLVGGRISEGAGQLNAGALQLGVGLQAATTGQSQLAEGTQKLSDGVSKLTDGMTALGAGIHTAAIKLPPDAKMDELAQGSQSLAGGVRDLRAGLVQLKSGARELSAGLDMLNQSLPTDIHSPDGSAKGLADSVEPVVEVVAPVVNNGAGFAPNFLATSLWMGAVMSAFLFHLRRLPLVAQTAKPAAQLTGKLAILACIVIAQSGVILLMTLFGLEISIVQIPEFVLTLVFSALSFLLIIVALTRAFGDAGKGVALILLILQLSAGGGVLPVELSGNLYQSVSPWLPFTWVIKALRVSMFGAFDGQWLAPWLRIGLVGVVAWICACYIGRWKFVGPDEHRPAMDI